ncbi:hypothetical protein I9Y19_001015 [Citrobacter freundii]|uniref:Terminase n=1 Tax=Citrobacter freundii TaxID=546 RepID=A0ABY7L0Q8_CITFR|nr:hypothetical protein [Citrobacter freundii]EIJ9080470.1 hypothetical protein [Citrobacter freundii]EJH9547601.1 hypothetical protein [Citrobacter freundii]EJO6482082.1 hypothetical protein [Citrobacter freundii]EKW5685432.1 hypothetical protein [Citrobacter freundii]EKX9686681.1 hypothetical protein [Citrobacter freundii]
MTKKEWDELQAQFLADHARTGIKLKEWCKARGMEFNSARRYIKTRTAQNAQEDAQKTAQKKVRNAQREEAEASKSGRVKKDIPDTGARSKSPETKPIRGSRTAPPTNAFQPGNQNALKHGGYGRRMLLSDAITEDAQMLTLDDELFWLRAASLTAAENIGRWQTELETADSEQAKDLHDLISQAQKAMHRNTARIESLEYTKSAIIKQRVDAAYREAATEKVELEIDVLKDGDKDNAIVVHNSLPIPGR